MTKSHDHTAETLLIFAVLTSPIRIGSDRQLCRRFLVRKCPDELRLTQQIPSNSFQSRFSSHFRFCNVLICSADADGNVQPIHRKVSRCASSRQYGFGSFPRQLSQCVSHCLCRCSCTRRRCCCFRLLVQPMLPNHAHAWDSLST